MIESLTTGDWIAVAGIGVAVLVAVFGVKHLNKKRISQKQSTKGGTSIQSGRDTKISK